MKFRLLNESGKKGDDTFSPASGEHEARTEIADLERVPGNNLNANLRCKGDAGATVHR